MKLKVNNLSKKFKEKIIFKNISFLLEEGECIGIIGKNGAGKSTLIECILNPAFKDHGTV